MPMSVAYYLAELHGCIMDSSYGVFYTYRNQFRCIILRSPLILYALSLRSYILQTAMIKFHLKKFTKLTKKLNFKRYAKINL